MKSIVALTSLALVSFSSVAPCLAATQAISRSPNPSLSSQPLPDAAKTTLVAGFNFGGLINQGLDVVKQDQRRKEEEERKAQQEKERQERLEAQKKQQEERAASAKREAEVETAKEADTEKQRLSTQPSSLTQNNSQSADNLHQVLKKRSNETYEQWYKRINPTILRISRAEYRAWYATLSIQDRKAYDATVRRKNREAADALDRRIPGILQDAAASQNSTRCWEGTPERTSRLCPPGSY